MRRKAKPKEGTDLAAAKVWFLLVTRDPKTGRMRPCLVCGSRWGVQAHHVLAKQIIKIYASLHGLSNAALQELLWDPANGIPICEKCHERHSSGFRRISRSLLPMRCLRFADRLGLGHRLDPPEYAA